MIVVTTETIPGREIVEAVGLCKGCSARAAHAASDIVANMKNKLGGEVHEYTQILAAAREQALDRMIEDARHLGGNAIVGAKFCSSEIEEGIAEMMCYGTAVRLAGED